LASAGGLFQVPRVLSCDEQTGILELERLHDLEPVQRLLAHGSAEWSIWSRLGTVLAVVHGDAALRAWSRGVLSEALPVVWRLQDEPEVAIHGDFDAGNIFYRRRDDMIVVLDWAVSPMLDVLCNVGPRCFDVAFFMSGAFFLPRRYLRHRKIGQKLRLFLHGYERELGKHLNRKTLVDFALRAAELRLERQPKSAMQRASYRRSLGRLTRFLEDGLDDG